MGNCLGGGDGGFSKERSAFDRVTSRTSKDDDCLLYQLADYQRGKIEKMVALRHPFSQLTRVPQPYIKDREINIPRIKLTALIHFWPANAISFSSSSGFAIDYTVCS